MIVKLTFGAMLLVALTALVTSQAASQEGADGAPDPEQMKKMMEIWEKVGTPNENHEHFKAYVGKWKSKNKFWMGGPGSPAMESEGEAEFSIIFGGRYLRQQTKFAMMGQEYEGLAYTGYDNYRKKFVQVWMDSAGTGMATFSGYLDRSGKVMSVWGEMDEPTMEMIGKPARFVTTWRSKDEFVLEAYDLHIGKDARVMEIVYKRAE